MRDDESPWTLERHVGRRLRAFRDTAGVTADRLASIAQELGLRWHPSTVAAIESGERELRAKELLLLPVLAWVLTEGEDVSLRDFLPSPETDREVQMTPGLTMPASWVATLVDPQVPFHRFDFEPQRVIPESEKLAHARRKRHAEVVPLLWPDASFDDMVAAEAAVGPAERKAARKLGVATEVLGIAARGLWGASLTEERDRRVKERSDGEIAKRSLQALRGHVTRDLLDELESRIAEASLATWRAEEA